MKPPQRSTVAFTVEFEPRPAADGRKLVVSEQAGAAASMRDPVVVSVIMVIAPLSSPIRFGRVWFVT